MYKVQTLQIKQLKKYYLKKVLVHTNNIVNLFSLINPRPKLTCVNYGFSVDNNTNIFKTCIRIHSRASNNYLVSSLFYLTSCMQYDTFLLEFQNAMTPTQITKTSIKEKKIISIQF